MAGQRSPVSGLQTLQLSCTPSGMGIRTSRSTTTPCLRAEAFHVVPNIAAV